MSGDQRPEQKLNIVEDYLFWPVGLIKRIRKHRDVAAGIDDFAHAHSSPGPFGLRYSGGGLLLPIKIFLPTACLVGAFVLLIFSFLIGAGLDVKNEAPVDVRATRQFVLMGCSGATFLIAILALAIRKVRGWLGLLAFAFFAVGFALILNWF